MGRSARGVIGMRLAKENDYVVSMEAVNPAETLLTVTENGYGKRTNYEEYAAKHRGSQGVVTIVTSERNGPGAGVRSVSDDDELILTSADGIIIRVGIEKISVLGRNTQGVRIMNLNPGDKVVSLARIGSAEKEPADDRQQKIDQFE